MLYEDWPWDEVLLRPCDFHPLRTYGRLGYSLPSLLYNERMQELDYRFGLFAIGCGIIATILFVTDMFDTPWVFENLRLELAFAAPPLVWLICRRAFHWTEPHR